MNKIFLFFVTLIIVNNLIFCEFNFNEYWYNPNGWKLPDIKKYKKKGKDKIFDIKNIKGQIVVENYLKKSEGNYYVFDCKMDKNFAVFLNKKTRYEINSFLVVKLRKKNFEKILLYVIDSFLEDEIIENQNGEIIGSVSGGSSESYILMDLNNDNIYELLYDGFSFGIENFMKTIKTLALFRYKKYLFDCKKIIKKNE